MKMLQNFYIFILLILLQIVIGKNKQELRIGGLFHHKEEELAFNLAIHLVNKNNRDTTDFKLVSNSYQVSPYNAHTIFLNACALLRHGIIGIFGPSFLHSSSLIQALCDRKEIPHIETHWDTNLDRSNCLVNLHPHPVVLSQVFLDIVVNWKWQKMIIIYENDESLSRIEPLLTLNAQHGGHVTLKQLETDADNSYRTILTNIKNTGETKFILDCSFDILENVLIQAQQVGIMTENYHYIITNLDLQTIDLKPFQYCGTNITGVCKSIKQKVFNQINDAFYKKSLSLLIYYYTNKYSQHDVFQVRLVDPINEKVIKISENISMYKYKNSLLKASKFNNIKVIKLGTALTYDAVTLFYETIKDLTTKNHILQSKPLYCNTSDNWENGFTIINQIKNKIINGLTGLIQFDNEGFRKDFTLDVIELSLKGLIKIGTWNSTSRLSISRIQTSQTGKIEEGSLTNKTFTVITCLTTPYGMLKETTSQLSGNDRFEGYSIDLINELSLMLGFNYTFVIQEDEDNGSYNQSTDQWTGLIGAIINGKADLGITDLTVTAERERAVDFTMQFMNLGISILYKKPEPVPPSLFMFTSPFSVQVWAMLGVAYLIVSLSLFIMGRISPNEWTNPYPCIEEPEYLMNQFSFRNSFWFTIGSLMQQGTEIAPIAISTRTVAGIWWFFILIMVSSYTANLAAFLTVETVVTSFNNLEELVEQHEIKYGAKRVGATANFFRDSNDTIKTQIWQFMSSYPKYMTNDNDEGVEKVEKENYAYFMESTTIEYVVERRCTLARVGGLLDEKGYAIALKKNSPYRNDLTRAILKLQESGRLAALKVKWWQEKRGAGNCGVKEQSEATPLNLQNVGGVFLVLFLGTLIGFLITIAEFIYKIYKKSKNANVSFKEIFKKEFRFFIDLKKNVKSTSLYSITENTLL